MQQIRAITLDLDDTLWAIAPVIERAERSLWLWLDSEYPRIGEHWDKASVAQLRDEVIAEHADKVHDLRFLRRTVLARMAESAGYGSTLVDDAFAVFDKQRNIVELFPDVVPGLERLANDFHLLALTNGNASLEVIGIRHLFADVIAAAEVGAAKPDARIFRAACELTGLRAEQILHVGDHPELDVDGARAAGMRTAWVNRIGAEWPAALPQPDATVLSIEELADWLHPVVAARRS